MKDEAGVLLHEGRLADAIESASAAVRADPIALGGRVLLAELLLLGG
jgi:protein involved in temperature-dependent protein secretion